MTIVDFPAEIVPRRENQNFWVSSVAGGPGRGTSRRQQIIQTENRIVVGQIDLNTLKGPGLLQMRAFASRVVGMSTVIRVPVCNYGTITFKGDLDAFYQALGVPQAWIDAGGIPFSDGSWFSDGSGFALPSPAEPTLADDVQEGDTTLDLYGFIGRNMSVGAYFSINEFLHIVLQNDNGRIEFSPPLREDYQAGQEIRVSNPTVRMRLQQDDGLRPFERHGRHVEPISIVLEEAFQR